MNNQQAVAETFLEAVDMAVLAGYETLQLDGEPDLIVELIDLYLDDAPRRVAALRESVARRDLPGVKREVHSLKGSSGNLGALRVAQICQELEFTEPGETWQSIKGSVSCLDLELERVIHIFLAVRQTRPLSEC